MEHARVVSGGLRLEAAADTFAVGALVVQASGTPVCRGGELEILVRLPSRISDPIFLRPTRVQLEAGRLRWELADRSNALRGRLEVCATELGLGFRVSVDAHEPVWMVEWKFYGLELEEVIVPALGGQVIDRGMPSGETLTFKYPFWWNAQFAVGSLGREEGLFLYTRKVEPSFRLLRIQKAEDGSDRFMLGLGFEARGPLRDTHLEAEWVLEAYEGDWRMPVERHRRWLESAFGVESIGRRSDIPGWARDVDFVLEMWGMRKDRGQPALTFPQMEERLEGMARLHPPETTLVYLPGFAEDGIDANAPSYEPSPDLGGREGFGRLVETAHRLGFRVMIHTNVLALAFSHPAWPELRNSQVVDVFGRPQAWGLDLDGDWLHEPYFAYVNPGEPAWTRLMTDILGELIRAFDLDAVFLDQTLLAFNVSRGPDFVSGMRHHIRSLQFTFPDVLFAGEGLHEQVLSVLPMAQVHGLDSLSGVHALDAEKPWRRAHRVSRELFGPYTRLVAHLLTAHPSMPAFERQETAYAALDVVPALVLWSNSQALDSPKLTRMLERARRLPNNV